MLDTDESKNHHGCWTMYGYLKNSGIKSVVRGQNTGKQSDRCEERKMSEISKKVSCIETRLYLLKRILLVG